jgi:integrase/recombinase XerD
MRLFPKRSRKGREKNLPAVQPVERDNPTLPAEANDDLVIHMWLAGRPANTKDAYSADIATLRLFTNNIPLKQINLLHLQQFVESMVVQAPATIARRVSAVKSLLTFSQKAGYTNFNVGAALRSPKVEERLAERIMSEAQFQRMLALETHPRHHAMIRLTYNAALRVSETCALTWNDLQEREQGGQLHIYGKGSHERYVLISRETYQEVLALKDDALADAPIFRSRKRIHGGFLMRGQVNKVVEAAAIRAGVATYQELDSDGEEVTRSLVSPHWLRHAHASHAIDKNAPLTLVRDTLGHKSIATTNKYAHARPDASSGTYLAI